MNNVFSEIKCYENVVDEEDFKHIFNELYQPYWEIQSSVPDDPNFSRYKFFYMNLSKREFFTVKLFDQIKLKIGSNFKLDTVYANCQHFGMPGRPHCDHILKNKYTFLLYANQLWKTLWGGQTIFFNNIADSMITSLELNRILSEETFTVNPKPNRGLLFPANIYHYAESPTKDCFNFRFTIAYKLEMI